MLNIDTKLSISVLITCHNRKNKTLECLRLLFLQSGLNNDFSIKVFLVDDASTDGTSEVIVTSFPEVRIIQGTGNLFWNRGMHLAWQVARKESSPDFYLWLNDDTYLFEDAIQQSLACIKAPLDIVCGSTCDENGLITYGGYSRKNKLINPNGVIQNCEYCNGNFILISAEVVALIGINDNRFSHGIGDFDYTVRAKKSRCNLSVAPKFVGTCSPNSSVPAWRNANFNMFQRLRYLYMPLSGCIPHEYFFYSKRKSGIFMAIIHYLTIHLRAILPGIWKDNL
jgi:GT2 family glycosyltransferase